MCPDKPLVVTSCMGTQTFFGLCSPFQPVVHKPVSVVLGGYSSVITALAEKKMFRAFGFGVSTSIFLIPTLFFARQRSVFAAERRSKPVNIAVVGAGIGGSSSSHFLREFFGPEATIDVFEASDRIGGRLDTIEIAGKSFESGGSIIHPDNKHMGDFVKLLGKFAVKYLVIFILNL